MHHDKLYSSQSSDPQIVADLESINFPQPVIADYEAEPYGLPPTGVVDPTQTPHLGVPADSRDRYSKTVDRRWNMVTEAARQKIVNDGGAREVAIQMASAALSEQLPGEAIEVFAARDAHIARVTRSAGKTLSGRLGLAPVPDAALQPDISNAAPIYTREQAANALKATAEYGTLDGYRRKLDLIQQTVQSQRGVSYAERDLVAQRYRYARDVKMLGLMAELHDNPVITPETPAGEDGIVRAELPSGTKLAITAEAIADNPDLLSPTTWESRRQLKDRVFVVRAGGREYIQKERKTNRHTDTMERGHKDSLTSAKEFETARTLHDRGEVKVGDVSLHWEKPVAYAEFADGYQFCLYEKEADVKPNEFPHLDLARGIAAAPESYKEEFADIQARAKDIYHQRADLIPGYLYQPTPAAQPPQPQKRFRLPRFGRSQTKPAAGLVELVQPSDELTYEEFADAKAQVMSATARDMLRETPLQLGYVNNDHDGSSLKVVKRDGRTELDAFGFDSEYYENNPLKAASLLREIRDDKANGRKSKDFIIIGYASGVKCAAILALLENAGIKMPSRQLTQADMRGAWT